VKTEAAILWGLNEPWSVEEIELDDPHANEIKVRLTASGLCHSDDHCVKGDLMVGMPIIGGHEGAGVVEAVGPGVKRLKEGDHVVLAFIPSCGYCRWCSSGHQNLCDLGATLMTGTPLDGTFRAHARGEGLRTMSLLGTFSPYVVCPEASAIKIDDDLPLDVAALVGCGVTTGWGAAVNLAKVEPGDTVVVVGAGGLGTSAIQGASVSGAAMVIAVDPVEFKRESALRFGATHTAPSMTEAMTLVNQLTRGVMADAAVFTASLAQAEDVGQLLSLIRKGGRAVITSTANPNVQQVNLSLVEFVFFQKELKGNVFGGGNPFVEIPKLLNLYRQGVLKLDEMVTTEYKLADINQGYADLLDGKNVRGLIRF
jgi:NDMA-dependent alcohol dehydrogenase